MWIRDLEKATEFIQNDVEDLKTKTNKEETERTTLTARIDVLEKQVQALENKKLKQLVVSTLNSLSFFSSPPSGVRARRGDVQVAQRVWHLEHVPHQVHPQICKFLVVDSFNSPDRKLSD